jgi:hypothetical protein
MVFGGAVFVGNGDTNALITLVYSRTHRDCIRYAFQLAKMDLSLLDSGESKPRHRHHVLFLHREKLSLVLGKSIMANPFPLMQNSSIASDDCDAQDNAPADWNWVPKFSLSTAFFCMTMVAALCVVLPAYQFFSPVWIGLSCGFLIAAGHCAHRQSVPTELAWAIFAFGWSIALASICNEVLDCFAFSNAPKDAQMELWRMYSFGISLPLLCSIRTVPRLIHASKGTASRSRKFLILFLLLAQFKLALATGFAVYMMDWIAWALGSFRF